VSSAPHIQYHSLYPLAHRTTLACQEHFQSKRMLLTHILDPYQSLLYHPKFSHQILLTCLTVSSSMAARALRSCPIYAHVFPAMTSPLSGPKLSRYAFSRPRPFIIPYSTFYSSINFSYALFPFYFTFLVLSHYLCLIPVLSPNPSRPLA
jgi:hypothetical protein